MFMTTQITHFTQWARDNPQRKYNSLLGMLFDPDGLNESFERQAANKAPGVDGMRKAGYGGDGLPGNFKMTRLRRLSVGQSGLCESNKVNINFIKVCICSKHTQLSNRQAIVKHIYEWLCLFVARQATNNIIPKQVNNRLRHNCTCSINS